MIFSESDTSFSLFVSPFQSEDELNTGLWLLLIGVNETPPHIALISEGKYYSVSTRKVDCGTPAENFLNAIERKRIPTLFINVVAGNNPELLQKIYSGLKPLGDEKTTCLTPIREFFAAFTSAEFKKINYVIDLLSIAERNDMLSKCISFFCNPSETNNVTLPKYTLVQIRTKIHELSSKHQTLTNT